MFRKQPPMSSLPQDSNDLARVTIESKQRALMELASSQSYLDLQQKYMSLIHMPDFRAFRQTWEATLYEPLRREMARLLAEDGGSRVSFAYVAPGPHVPVLSREDGAGRAILDRLGRLALIDISADAEDAIPALRNAAPDIDLSFCAADLTAGMGRRFAERLFGLVQASAGLDEIGDALADEATADELLDFAAADLDCIAGRPALRGETFDVTYSEMVATFVGTAPAMAAETMIFRRFPPTDAQSAARLKRVGSTLWSLWQRFNGRMFAFHLASLARITRPGGHIVVATDFEKVFDAPQLPSVHSFPHGVLPGAIPGLALNRALTTIAWRDHEHDFDTVIFGMHSTYFRAHTHRVLVYDFRKAD